MKPVLSVIVPVYNVEPYIRQCLDSLVNQTYQDIEIIVIDDGSSDNCGAICDEYAAKYPKLRVIHQKNAGVQAARNHGIAESQGEWIAFVDSDDWLDTDFYARMFEALGGRKPDIFIAGGAIKEYPSYQTFRQFWDADFDTTNQKELDKLLSSVVVPFSAKSKAGRKDFYAANLAVPWDKFYRSDFLKKSGVLFDPNQVIHDDLLFNWRVFPYAKRIAGCAAIGYHFRQRPVSISRGFKANVPEMAYRCLEQSYDNLPERENKELIFETLRTLALGMMKYTINFYYASSQYPGSLRDAERGICEMKKRPLYRDALLHCPSRPLPRNYRIALFLLRLPSAWPLLCAYRLKNRNSQS